MNEIYAFTINKRVSSKSFFQYIELIRQFKKIPHKVETVQTNCQPQIQEIAANRNVEHPPHCSGNRRAHSYEFADLRPDFSTIGTPKLPTLHNTLKSPQWPAQLSSQPPTDR